MMETETKMKEDGETGNDWASRVCYEHGLFCATHPNLVFFFTAVVIFTCR